METLIEIIGTIYSIPQYVAFLFFTTIGMGLVKLIRYQIKFKKALRDPEMPLVKFSIKIWLSDNLLDFVIAFIASFLTLRFLGSWLKTLKLPLPEDLEAMFYGLMLGLAYQWIFHKLMNRVSIKISE